MCAGFVLVRVLFGTDSGDAPGLSSPAMPGRVAILAQGPDLETQWAPLRDEVKRRGFSAYRRYTEIGQLMRDVRRGEASAVIVVRLDYFARSIRDLRDALEEFQKRGVDFISLNERIDTSTDSQFMANVSAIAAFEHAILQGRILEGLDRARRQGKRLGRPPNGSKPDASEHCYNDRRLPNSAMS